MKISNEVKIRQESELVDTRNVKLLKLRDKHYIQMISVLLAVLLIYSYGYQPHDDDMHVYFLDVGQGDSIVIADGDAGYIVDGGGDRFMSDTFNKGKEVLIPFLKAKGIDTIECAFITHTHYDHIKGILEIIGIIPIKFIVLSKPYAQLLTHEVEAEEEEFNTYFLNGDEHELLEELIKKATEEEIPILFMESGDELYGEQLSFKCLYPKEGQRYSSHENENSLVLRLDSYGFSCVLTGDVEEEGEKWMVANEPLLKNVSLIKVPHHGSNSSSTEEFVSETNANGAIICVGSNFFGHPSDIIRLRYKNLEIPLYTTQKYGMIEVIIDEDGYRLQSHKGELEDEAVKRTIEK